MVKIHGYAVIRLFFWILFGIFAFFILSAPPENCNHTLIVSLIPIFSACLIVWYKRGDIIPDRTETAAGIPLTVLFLLMLSVFEILGNEIFSGVRGLFYVLFLGISVFITVCYCLRCFSERKAGLWCPEICGTKRIFRVYVVLAVLFLLANFPFRPSPDAMTVYDVIETGSWADWHTIGYISFVDLCMTLASPIIRHPFSVCIVQTVFWLLIVRRNLAILRECLDSERAARIYLIVNTALFVPLLYLGVMYKDVVFSMCMLGYIAELFRILHTGRTDRKGAVCLALFAAGVGIFRHMGIITAAVCLLVPAVYLFLKKNRSWRVLLGSVLFAGAVYVSVVYGYGYGVLNMQKNPDYIKFTVPLYITGNLASEHPELFDEKDREVAERLMTMDEWVEAYELDTYFADNLARGGGIIGDRINRVDNAYGWEIVKLNLRMLVRAPIPYVSALFRITSIIWQTARPADGYEWTVAGYYTPSDQPELEERHLITEDTVLARILGQLEYGLEEQPFVSFLYYRGGIWAFLLVFAAAVFIIKKRWEFLMIIFPGAMNTAFMMLACPSQDPRFVLPVMEMGMFILPAAYFIKGKRREKYVYQ